MSRSFVGKPADNRLQATLGGLGGVMPALFWDSQDFMKQLGLAK